MVPQVGTCTQTSGNQERYRMRKSIGVLLIFILTIHIPHLLDGSERVPIMIALLKDISLMGGSLMIAGYCAESETKKEAK